jgi:hypothetical protein
MRGPLCLLQGTSLACGEWTSISDLVLQITVVRVLQIALCFSISLCNLILFDCMIGSGGLLPLATNLFETGQSNWSKLLRWALNMSLLRGGHRESLYRESLSYVAF